MADDLMCIFFWFSNSLVATITNLKYRELLNLIFEPTPQCIKCFFAAINLFSHVFDIFL